MDYSHGDKELYASCGVEREEFIDVIYSMLVVAQSADPLSKGVELVEEMVKKHPRESALHIVGCFCAAMRTRSRMYDIVNTLKQRLSQTSGGADPDMNIEYQALITDFANMIHCMNTIVMSTREEYVTFN
jgi:hypothetical protein